MILQSVINAKKILFYKKENVFNNVEMHFTLILRQKVVKNACLDVINASKLINVNNVQINIKKVFVEIVAVMTFMINLESVKNVIPHF